jgi:maltodextrin utilization protein YvdJ
MLACSVCFGQSDSALALGTNMGVFFMLGVTVLMLAAFATFFIYLIRRKRLFADDVMDSVPAHERTV